MITNNLNPKQYLRKARVLYFSIWGGLTGFLIIVLYITDSKFLFTPGISDPLMLSTFILACIILPAGYLFAKMTFRKTDPASLLSNKLARYNSGQIIRLATCECIGILALVSLLLTSNLFFLVFLFVAFFIMMRYYPTTEKIGREMNLTQTEIDLLNEHKTSASI